MLELELEIMLICIRPETDLLDNYLGGVLLHLLSLLLLLIQIFLIVQNLAYRRVSFTADFHKIQFHFISHLHGLCNRIYSRFR